MKVKVKTKKVSVKDDELSEMFNKMLDINSADAHVIYPKYVELIEIYGKLADVLTIVSETLKDIEDVTPINFFCVNLRKFSSDKFTLPTDDYISGTISDEKNKQLLSLWQAIKNSDTSRTLILMCNNLAEYHKNFDDLNHLNPKFVITMPGTDWYPFPFVDINVKIIRIK